MWYCQTAPLPSCKVESLETRMLNIQVLIYRLWCFTGTSWHIFTFFVTFRSPAVVQNLSISTRGWLYSIVFFDLVGTKCTQFLSGVKKVNFSLYISIEHTCTTPIELYIRTRGPIYAPRHARRLPFSKLNKQALLSVCLCGHFVS